MFPVHEDLLIDLGSSLSRSFTYIKSDGTQPDLSDWTAQAVFKRSPGARASFLTLAQGAGITLGQNGAIAMNLTPAQSAALVLPEFMDWGAFPSEGTMASPDGVNVTGRLAAWELRLTSEDGQTSFVVMAGVACFRLGTTSPLPEVTTPFYSISVEPQESEITWTSSGYQVDAPLVLAVTITRLNGHTDPINVSIPVMEGPWDGFEAIVNGVTLTPIQAQHNPYVLDGAPDTFTLSFYGTQAGWSLQNWQGGVQLYGDDGSGLLVKSNVFSVIT